MLSIQTNVNSLVAQENLQVNSKFQSQTIQRLTSGYRINSSGDDAAGLAVANKFRSDVAELSQGVRNANDGISQLQIIDGGLTNISQMLDRLKTLATQSASTTFTGDRTSVNNEFQSVLGEINRQAADIKLDSSGAPGTFMTKMSVYLGGGNASNATNNNAQVAVDLSSSPVDTTGLGIPTASVLGGGVEFSGTAALSNKWMNDPGSTFAAQTFTVKYIDANGAAKDAGGAIAIQANATGAQAVIQLNAALASAKVSGISAQIGSDGNLQFVGSGAFTVSTTAAVNSAVTQVGDAGTMTLVNTGLNHLTSGAFTGYDNATSDALTITDAKTGLTDTFALNNLNADTMGNAIDNLNKEFKAKGLALTALDDGTGTHISLQSAGDFRVIAAHTGAGAGASFATVDTASTKATPSATSTGAALAAIDSIAVANKKLGLVQGRIGTGENQLAYAINLAQSQISNFSAAGSQIRDADVASEAANLSKSQVLQQASIAAMAQANSAPQQVLSLLRG